ncbi:MAG: CoA transferase [bacterium]
MTDGVHPDSAEEISTDVTPAALAGVRIVELGHGPTTGLAGMIFADFGAEVIRIRSPRTPPHEQLAGARMWHRGKHVLALDLDQTKDQRRLQQLLAGADVLLCNWRPASLRARELDYAHLKSQHPHLHLCHITGFGADGPMANCPGYEHVVAAYCGRMQLFSGIVDRRGPVFSALQVGIHACVQAAVSGILSALYASRTNQAGQLIETSILQGMLAYEQGPMLGSQVRERFPDLLPALAAPGEALVMPSLFYHPAQAADGRWMQFGNLLPHLFDNFLIATDLIDIVADPDFNPKQLLLTSKDKHEAFRDRMLKRIAQRPAAQWMADLIADGGVVAGVYQTTQEALHDPDVVANGHVIETGDGHRQLGPLARMTKTPAQPGGAHEAPATDALLQQWLAAPRQPPTELQSDRPQQDNTPLPLAGIKVVEIATIIAAPLGASFLADMGATVIKIEQAGGDPFRGMLSGIGSARVNPGKQSISLNMKSAQGQKIVHELVADADIVIHNYRPGVPERLGIDYPTLAALNPGLIYLQCNGYGPDGPSALRPSTHPIPGAAMGGVMYQMGEQVPDTLQSLEDIRLWSARLMRANEVNPDPNTAMVVTSAALLGLCARQTTGTGQQILVDMFGANAYANHDDFLDYPDKPARLQPDAHLHGLSPSYRLYACEGDDWVFLGLLSEAEKARFSETLTAAGITPAGELDWQAGDADLSACLSQLFKRQSAAFWQALFIPADVACVTASGHAPNTFWLNDAQVDACGFIAPAVDPQWGQYFRHGPMVKFNGKTQQLGGAPSAGADNRHILTALGYSPTEIDNFTQQGVIWSAE